MSEVEKHRLLIEHLPDAYAYYQLVTDSAGNPLDYIVLDVNRAFEKMFNLRKSDVMGKKIKEVFPNIKTSPFAWLENFSEAPIAGENLRLEHYCKPLKRWYEITACSDEPGFFAVFLKYITEHKKEIEKKHRRLFETMNQGVIYQDADSTIISANPAAERILGLSLDQMQGKTSMDPHWQMIKEDGTAVPGTEHPAMLALKTGQRVGPVTRGVFHPDKNAHIWLKITAIPLFQPGEAEPYQVYATFEDITERKQAEEALQQAHLRLTTVVDSMDALVYIIDMDTYEILFVNEYGRKVWGDISGQKCWKAIQGQDGPCPFCTNDKLVDIDGNPTGLYKWELQNTLNGRWYDCRDRVVPWFDGRLVRMEIATDITERKETEKKLKENEEKFRTLFEQNIVALYLHDFDGNIIDVNYQACLQLGYSYEELLKMSVFDFIYTKESGGYLSKEEILKIWNQMHVGERTTVEDVHQSKDGTLFYVEISTGVIRYNNKNIIMALAKDITERKQTEKMIQSRLNLLTFATNNPLEAVLQKALDEVCELLNSPIGFFHFVSADERMLTLKAWSTDTLHSFCEMDDQSGMQYSVDEAGVWVDCVHERKPVIHNDYASLPHRKGLPEGHTMVTRELVVPVMRNDRIVAILGLGNKPQDYEDTDIQIVSFFADVAWEIVEDKFAAQKLAEYTLELEQLYHHLDEEMDKARQIHERTLPTSLPTVEGISFAAHYQPAKKMGGDFYNIIHKDNKLVFYLSDVSGHSLDGAMLSVFIKEAIDSYMNLKPDHISPQQIIKHLSRQYGSKNYDEELYFCIFIAVLDLDTLKLSYCGAGFQEKMLLRVGNGDRLAIAARGMFITSYLPAEMLTLKEQSVVITPGTTIFLTTDGLTEQGAQGVFYRDRLPDVFYANAHLPAHQVAQAVVEDFRKFNNGSLQGNDDITFLVLQVEAT